MANKDDDRPCPCGVSHTIAEHNYDPDKHDGPDPDDPPGILFYNVNEEGVPYDQHADYESAEAVLRQFPNDSIVVVTVDSPKERMLADYKGFTERAKR